MTTPEKKEKKKVYVGIDLGTTFSSVCYINPQDNKPVMIQSQFNRYSIPSIVEITTQEVKVGDAVNPLNMRDGSVIHEVKRFMGKEIPKGQEYDEKTKKLIEKSANKVVQMEYTDDEKQYLIESERRKNIKEFDPSKMEFLLRLGIEVNKPKRRQKGQKGNQIEKLQLLPEYVSSMVLMKLKENIERRLGEDCDIYCVVGVPAAFQNKERRATEVAIKMSGMKLIKLINEPTAAAKAYRLNSGKLLVYDFGGGTLDISIIDHSEGANGKVLISYGDAFCGGNDVDYNIMNWLEEELVHTAVEEWDFKEDEIREILQKKKGKLKKMAEDIKKGIGAEYQGSRENAKISIEVDDLEIEDVEGVELEFTWETFTQINADVFNKCEECLDTCMRKCGLTNENIDKVIMTGGSCQIPVIQNMLIDYFGKSKVDLSQGDFDLLVSKGCAYEATAVGSSLQAAEIGEVCSTAIGVRVKDENGQFKIHEVIPIGTPIPLQEPKIVTLTTTENCQNNMDIKVFEITKEGAEDEEREIVKELSKFDIYPLPQQPAKQVDVDVKFNIGTDCKLVVTCELSKVGLLEKGTEEFEEYKKQIQDKEQVNIEPERKNVIEERIEENAKKIRRIYKGEEE